MDKEKMRGDDAADHAPRPGGDPPAPPKGHQDAPNYDNRDDGGRAVPIEDLDSANDE